MPTKPRTKRRRGAETPARLHARLTQIIARLEQAYSDATCALHHRNPLELLVATILSAQSTDARVNMVTPALFTKYRTARDFADRKSTRLNSSHITISYAVFCLKKKKKVYQQSTR